MDINQRAHAIHSFKKMGTDKMLILARGPAIERGMQLFMETIRKVPFALKQECQFTFNEVRPLPSLTVLKFDDAFFKECGNSVQ